MNQFFLGTFRNIENVTTALVGDVTMGNALIRNGYVMENTNVNILILMNQMIQMKLKDAKFIQVRYLIEYLFKYDRIVPNSKLFSQELDL